MWLIIPLICSHLHLILGVNARQELDYKHDSVLGIAATWPQMAAPVPSQEDWFDWEGDRPLNIPLEQLIIYEMHVRGFTRHPSANASAPGKARGHCTLSVLFLAASINLLTLCRHAPRSYYVSRLKLPLGSPA